MKFLQIAFLFISITAFSQSKVGTINIDFVISKMTEYPTVQSSVETYGKELDGKLENQLKSYEALVEDYKATQATLTEAQKKEKQNAILIAENDINKFRKNGVQLIAIKRDELLRPLYRKIGASLEKVAKAQAYTQVLQITDDLVYIDQNYDLTEVVLKDLGITLTEEDKK